MYTNPENLLTPPASSHSAASPASCREHVGHPLKQDPPSIYCNDLEDIILPPPSALTACLTHYAPEPPSPLEDFSSAARGYDRSSTGAFLGKAKMPPLITRPPNSTAQSSRISLPSPTKSLASFIPSRLSTTEDSSNLESKRRSGPLFGDWFSGTSAPISIGIIPAISSPTKEKENPMEPDSLSKASSSPTNKPKRTTTAQPTPTRFSWFNTKPSPFPPTSVPSASPHPNPHSDPDPDPLLHLNITASLFPHGPADPLSPTSFNDLLTNAESLISRLHAAYRAKCAALHDLALDLEVADDELDEAETRARHLKAQLDDMAARVAEREGDVRALEGELAQERRRRREEEETRGRSVRLVKDPYSRPEMHGCNGKDVGVSRGVRGHKRVSGGSVGSFTSDSGFGSDGESVFSHGRGGKNLSEVETPEGAFSEADITRTSPLSSIVGGISPPHLTKRRSTYDRVLHGEDAAVQRWRCSSCGGGSEASAWAVASTFKEQNKRLQARVGELEETVEGCLSLVAGLR